jgi:CheY-like chemotaxis protein
LDGTCKQFERDHNDTLADIAKLDNEKNQLVVNIQKFGATPVAEPSPDDISPRAAEPVVGESDGSPEAVDDKEAGSEPTENGDESHEESEATEEVEEATEVGVAQAAGPTDPRLFIVDDNADLRDLLSKLFGKEYQVDRAVDGLEVFNMILKECRKHEAILTDLNTPNVDGTTFLEHVPKETSVIVMSAYLDRPEFEAASGSGRTGRPW